jgi:lipoate-protein ligase A
VYVVDENNICWSVVCNEEQSETALETFMKLHIPVTNKHAPIKKMTVKTNC